MLSALFWPPLMIPLSLLECDLQEPPESLVMLLADLAAMLGSPASLLQDLAATSAQSQQQQSSAQPPAADAQQSSEAVMAALQQASTNLQAIQQDPLLAGELSAVGGYWLLRRFLPTLHKQPDMVLHGLSALQGLGYRVSCRAWRRCIMLAVCTVCMPHHRHPHKFRFVVSCNQVRCIMLCRAVPSLVLSGARC